MKYKILQADSLINEEQLEELSEEGWALVSIVPFDSKYYFYFVWTGVTWSG